MTATGNSFCCSISYIRVREFRPVDLWSIIEIRVLGYDSPLAVLTLSAAVDKVLPLRLR